MCAYILYLFVLVLVYVWRFLLICLSQNHIVFMLFCYLLLFTIFVALLLDWIVNKKSLKCHGQSLPLKGSPFKIKIDVFTFFNNLGNIRNNMNNNNMMKISFFWRGFQDPSKEVSLGPSSLCNFEGLKHPFLGNARSGGTLCIL